MAQSINGFMKSTPSGFSQQLNIFPSLFVPKVIHHFFGSLSFVNVDDPAAAIFVALVFPHGPDVLLEEGVVTARFQIGH